MTRLDGLEAIHCDRCRGRDAHHLENVPAASIRSQQSLCEYTHRGRQDPVGARRQTPPGKQTIVQTDTRALHPNACQARRVVSESFGWRQEPCAAYRDPPCAPTIGHHGYAHRDSSPWRQPKSLREEVRWGWAQSARHRDGSSSPCTKGNKPDGGKHASLLVKQAVSILAQQLFENQMIHLSLLAPEDHQRDDLDFFQRDGSHGGGHGAINHDLSQRSRQRAR